MKVIKLALLSLVFFSAIIFLISLLIPADVRISRAVNIQSENIEPVLSDLKNWSRWNEMYNDSMQVTLLSVRPGMVQTLWSYHGSHVPGNFRVEHAAGVSVVQWYFDFHLGWYPWKKFSSIVFDKEFGPPMERSLNNLKKLVENSP